MSLLNLFGTDLHTLQRRKPNKPRDTTTAQGETPAESVWNLIKKNPKYSKRINYDVLKDLFVDNNDDSFKFPSLDNDEGRINFDEKDDADLFTMDDDKIDEDQVGADGVLIIEEENGAVPMPRGNDDMEDVDDGDAGGSWEDAYEQEV
jgi:transcription factor IIIB subunit 2